MSDPQRHAPGRWMPREPSERPFGSSVDEALEGDRDGERTKGDRFYSPAVKWLVRLVLLLASLITSRLVFAVIGDPEGPNVVVVCSLALVLFAASTLLHRLVVKRAGRAST